MTSAPTQGDVIAAVADQLRNEGWQVVFVSMPNTAHLGVVPIPTVHPGSRQRYPDIVATDGRVTLLLEIEPRYSTSIAVDIAARFRDHGDSLAVPDIWRNWCAAIAERTGVVMPETFEPQCALIVCAPTPRLVEPNDVYETFSFGSWEAPAAR